MIFKSRNNYNGIAEQYKKSDVKPDKQYSILSTTLKMIGDVQGKTVLDLGCWNGFFIQAFDKREVFTF